MLVQFTDRDGDPVGIDAGDAGNVFVCNDHRDGCVLVRMKDSKQARYGDVASTNVHLKDTTVEAVIEALNAAGA